MSDPTPRTASLRTIWDRARRWHPSHRHHAMPRRASLSRQDELVAQLSFIGLLCNDRIDLPGSNRTLQITRPADICPFFDAAVADPTQADNPYWSKIWPSGVVLAGVIAREPGIFQGKRVLELGPGVGVTAVAAMDAGADLVVADSAPGSLALCALNALDQVGREPQTLLVDWRDSSPDLVAAAGAGFAVVLAADVLYDRQTVKPMKTLLERLVAPGGEVWIADPGRGKAEYLVDTLRRRGWWSRSEECASPLPDPMSHTRDIVTVHRLHRPLGAGMRSVAPNEDDNDVS